MCYSAEILPLNNFLLMCELSINFSILNGQIEQIWQSYSGHDWV